MADLVSMPNLNNLQTVTFSRGQDLFGKQGPFKIQSLEVQKGDLLLCKTPLLYRKDGINTQLLKVHLLHLLSLYRAVLASPVISCRHLAVTPGSNIRRLFGSLSCCTSKNHHKISLSCPGI